VLAAPAASIHPSNAATITGAASAEGSASIRYSDTQAA
jgi:hypothetical protein